MLSLCRSIGAGVRLSELHRAGGEDGEKVLEVAFWGFSREPKRGFQGNPKGTKGKPDFNQPLFSRLSGRLSSPCGIPVQWSVHVCALCQAGLGDGTPGSRTLVPRASLIPEHG